MVVRRKWWIGTGLVLLTALVVAGWQWRTISARAGLGAAYGARIGCSCRYVEGRAMGSCETDKEPGMAMVRLTDHPDSRSVEGSVPLIATRTARFKPGWGCLLDPVG